MADVDIALMGRVYRIACADGQENHVNRLGRYIDQKVRGLVKSPDQPVDVRILLMATLLIADELSEAEARLDELASAAKPPAPLPATPAPIDPALASRVETLAGRIETIAARLNGDYV